MTISLEKKLEEATIAKKRYRSLFLLASISFIVLLGIVYNNIVLDYAVLDNIKINRERGTNNVNFRFDVVKSGRIDFIYGNAILTDRQQVQQGQGFDWNWNSKGKTEISIRSRKFIFPYWTMEEFIF